MRLSSDIEKAIDAHGDTVWRVCVLYFKYGADAQDAFQDTWLKYSLNETAFEEENHRRAWLIRVAVNVCKDMLKAAHRRNLSLEEGLLLDSSPAESLAQTDSGISEVIEAIRSLADPPRTPVYLALYEGYTASEISEILGAPVNTVYSWVARGKKQLKEVLG